MSIDYSVNMCKTLEKKFLAAKLHRPMRVRRYDPGTQLTYDVTDIKKSNKGKIHLVINKYVGGGFAGQVYQVKVQGIETENGPIGALKVNKIYAMKIFIPPSNFSLLFRNVIYWIGFQGPFQLQVNPAAALAGAIWQKFIRRAAKIRFGNVSSVNDIHTIFIDKAMGSCGELSDWVDGRTWKLEVDDQMDLLKQFYRGKSVDQKLLGSPEFRAKKKFMADFVKLLHDMGAYEFARQYEWSTCKTQPNCLKYQNTENNPSKGLVAVDFRPGLALLPFLPMSPGDFKLILKGLGRLSLIQFDRGNLKKLEQFVEANKHEFSDMQQMLDELKKSERIYRDSIPDITHNHLRLLFSKKLWSTIFKSSIVGWKVKNLIDKNSEKKLKRNKVYMLIFYIIGIIPFLGKFFRKILGRTDWRKHYKYMLTSFKYLHRSIRGRIAEKLISWVRVGRIDSNKAIKVAESFWRYFFHLPFSILPAKLHKFLTDWKYTKNRLNHFFIRPIKLYFYAEIREQWLRDMVSEGQKKHMLSDEDARTINSKLKEPFIQKYLKSLAVHIFTLPVTQIVSIIVSWIYVKMHPEMSNMETMAAVGAILILFQITPISPGSLVRGFYVLYLIIKERNFKDYNIAVFLGFFKYIGYLAFPIQMTYRYPTLARFMATHWATDVVHIIPVFGERGALLEHWVFRLFYNWPLTIRSRMQKISRLRALLKPRYWHISLYALVTASFLRLTDFLYFKYIGLIPSLKDTWWIVIILILAGGTLTTIGCRGATLTKRIISATVYGFVTGLLYTVASALFVLQNQITINVIISTGLWRIFIFSTISTLGAVVAEIKRPDPDLL